MKAPETLREYYEDLQEKACRVGIDPLKFWNYTLKELLLLINSNSKAELDKMRFAARVQYDNARLVISLLNGGECPQMKDLYPFLFDAEELKPQAEDWQIIKERMLKAAKGRNEQLKRKG